MPNYMLLDKIYIVQCIVTLQLKKYIIVAIFFHIENWIFKQRIMIYFFCNLKIFVRILNLNIQYNIYYIICIKNKVTK